MLVDTTSRSTALQLCLTIDTKSVMCTQACRRTEKRKGKGFERHVSCCQCRPPPTIRNDVFLVGLYRLYRASGGPLPEEGVRNETSAKALRYELLADPYLNNRGTIPELGLEENVGSTEESFFQTDDDLKSGVACV